MTILELYQQTKLFKGNEKLTFIGEFRPYKENKCIQWFNQEFREMLDNYFICNYYDYKILPIDVDFIKNIIQSVFEVNANKYNKMYGALYYYEFNPLWNVDGVEITTTEFGEQKSITNYGEVTNTNTLGETNGTNTTGARSGDNTDKKNGFDNLVDEVQTEAQNLWTSASATDTFHQDEVSNNSNTSAHSDNVTNNSHIDKMTHERSGNIGVTKSTELLNDAIVFYKNNLIKEIANDVIAKITLGVW